MKQVLITRSGVEVQEVPAPAVEAGTVLVRVSHSCVSVGTEMRGVKETNTPLWKRALAQPQQVKRLAELALNQGLGTALDLVGAKLAEAFPTGYSAAGTVIETGAGVTGLQPGDRVACAGAQCAHHAEVIRVPGNLTVPVPPGVSFEAASTVTLGAIALQGVRRAQPTLGESFVVVGLGFLGQLTAQVLKAAGCRVIGIDLDRRRLEQARAAGMDIALHPDDGATVEQVTRLTDGNGADGVIVTASSPSDAVISTAFQMCRRKARVVLVGDVGLDIRRADLYAKELDFLISTSYGPGRYDRTYEERGLDYPLPYVRWTENRNLAEYLNQVAAGRIRLEGLLGAVFPVEAATTAYQALAESPERPLLALLRYPEPAAGAGTRTVVFHASPAGAGAGGPVGLALIGGGGFAKSMHLPLIRQLSAEYRLRAVASRTGHNAAGLARGFGAAYATTEVREVLEDPGIEAVLIATRHDTHAELVLQALAAGKHVLVEKPLCLTRDELDRIRAAVEAGGAAGPVLLTGFNRRFSPCARALKAACAARSNPMMINYRVNAGHLPAEHWVHGPEGGGRNLGEACHFYDLIGYLTEAPVTTVTARAIRPATGFYGRSDNFAALIGFGDGSVATLNYTALGATDYPKELLDCHVDGKVLQILDFKEFRATGAKITPITGKIADKGHGEELKAFARTIRGGGSWPISFAEQVRATELALAVQDQIMKD